MMASPTLEVDKPKPDAHHSHKRVLGLWGFAAVAYFAVAGGPFGVEAAVMHAGPLPAFIGFLAIPLVWSLPQALITAELSTLLPDNGGFVLWVTHAFGDFAAWMVGLNGVLGSVLDLTLYPVLFSQIVSDAWLAGEANMWIHWGMRLLLVTVGVTINIRGVSNVSIVSAVISVAVIIPFLVSLIAQFATISNGIAACTQSAKIIDWAAFLSTILWSYTGWDGLGCIAGEVIDPARTYVRGTTITLVFVTITYALPLFVSITTHPKYWTWNQGNFAKFTGDVAEWLGITATVVALLCQLGIFTTGLSTNSRAAWALAGGSNVRPALADGTAGASRNAEPTSVSHFPRFFSTELKSTGAPIVSIIAHAVLIALLCLLPFDTLVQADVMLACVRLTFEIASFLWLRIKEPTAIRDPNVYYVPWGWVGIALTTLPKLGIICFVVLAADPAVWVVTMLINVFAAIVFGVRVMYDRKVFGRWWPRGHCNLGIRKETSTQDKAASGLLQPTDQEIAEFTTAWAPITADTTRNRRRPPTMA